MPLNIERLRRRTLIYDHYNRSNINRVRDSISIRRQKVVTRNEEFREI